MIIISDIIQFVNQNIVLNVSGASLSGTNNIYEWYLYSNQVGNHSTEIDIISSATSQTIQYSQIGSYYPAVRTRRSGVGELNSYYQTSIPIIINPVPKLRYEGTSLVNDVMTFYDLRSSYYGTSSISATSINFGDGVILTSAGSSNTFLHSYPVAGSYSVTLTVIDNIGNVSTYVEIVEIIATTGHISTSANYITLLGPDTYRYTENKLINLRQYLPSTLIETPTEQYLEVFENFLNEMYGGTKGIENVTNNNNIDFIVPDDTMKISILEKIHRLTELQDPELIDLEYIQFFAKNLGYTINISRNDIAGDSFGNLGVLDNNASNIADQRKYLRFVIQNLPNWYKIKTTKNCISIMLYSFGLIGDLVELYTKEYSNNKTDWNINNITNLNNDWYPTSHFTIMIDIDTSVNIVNDINNKNSVIAAIESVKPINTVFENLSGKFIRYCKMYVQGLTRISKHIRIEDIQFPSDYWYL